MKSILILLSFGFICCSPNIEKNNTSANDTIKTFTWSGPICDYTGSYNSTVISYKQIKNLLDLDPESQRFSISQIQLSLMDVIHESDLIKVDSLDNEYHRKMKDLQTLEIIDKKYWKKLRQDKISELKKEYELVRLQILSYKYPDTLNFKGCPDICKKYIPAIKNGGDDLIKAWENLHKERLAISGNYEAEIDQFNKEYNSPDKLLYAKRDIIVFGWWNCANSIIPHVDFSEFQNEFEKNFISVETLCED